MSCPADGWNVVKPGSDDHPQVSHSASLSLHKKWKNGTSPWKDCREDQQDTPPGHPFPGTWPCSHRLRCGTTLLAAATRPGCLAPTKWHLCPAQAAYVAPCTDGVSWRALVGVPGCSPSALCRGPLPPLGSPCTSTRRQIVPLRARLFGTL